MFGEEGGYYKKTLKHNTAHTCMSTTSNALFTSDWLHAEGFETSRMSQTACNKGHLLQGECNFVMLLLYQQQQTLHS